MEQTDGQLLSRYRKGHVDALERLVARYERPLFGYIHQMTNGRDEADEIFQEVWLRVIHKHAGFRQGNFLGWLIRIARNLAIDRARRKRPALSLDEEPEEGAALKERVPSPDPTPAARLEAADVGRRIEAAVARLPAEQKEVFVMRMEAGLPFKEIARLQKVSINTALARMHYAVLKLRSVLQDDYAAMGTRP